MAPSRLAPTPHREGERIVSTVVRLTKKEKIEILRRAKALLRRRNGWTKGTLRRVYRNVDEGVETYAYCVLGACQQAAIDKGVLRPDSPWWNTEAVYPLARRLGITRPGAAVRLNDSSKTKKADVILLLDEQIKALEAA